jgi:geranylgeranyl pyrophosphate synthase
MDLYEATWDTLSALPTVQEWPELRDLLYRTVRNRPPHWWMAGRACLATGGTLAVAIPAVAALSSLFLTIILVDDVLDEDPRGHHNTLGYGAVANMASALQATGFEAIARSSLPLPTQTLIHQRLNRMMLLTSLGQYLDSKNACDEEAYWQVTRTKSSPFFATSFFVGALMSGSSEATANQLAAIGEIYGEMVQINDDLNDSLAEPANADWVQGRYPLPILFATLVPHPERERFITLRAHVHEAWALGEAQEILIRCGAISYGIDQLLQRAQQVNQMLDQLPLARREVIDEMMAAMMEPVQKLLEHVTGAQQRAVVVS